MFFFCKFSDHNGDQPISRMRLATVALRNPFCFLLFLWWLKSLCIIGGSIDVAWVSAFETRYVSTGASCLQEGGVNPKCGELSSSRSVLMHGWPRGHRSCSLDGGHKSRLHLLSRPRGSHLSSHLIAHTRARSAMSALRTNLSFDLNEENDITAIRDSDTGSVVYTVKTSGCVGGALATTFARRNQLDGSTRSAFKILWKGGKESLKDVMIVLEDRTSEEIPAGELLERAQGRNT